MTLPTGIPYGRVTYAAIRGVVDSVADADDLPDARPVLGSVTFTATLTDPVSLLGQEPLQLFIPPQVFRVIDVEGVGRLVDDSGRTRVVLVSNDLAAVAGQPTWRWRAAFALQGLTQARPPVQFDLAAGQAIDLTDFTPPVASLAPPILRGRSAYEVAVDNGFTGDQQAWLASLIGPPGAAGGAGSAHVHEQTSPSASWSIPHTFGRLPLVDLYVDGQQVEADVEATTTTVSVTFPTPTAGTAVLA